MRNVTGLLFAIMFLALGQPSHAEAFIVGVGASQCGKFLDQVEDSSNVGQIAEMVYTAWMQGYLSGTNIAAAAGNKRMGLNDRTLDLQGVHGQFRWVKNYCSRNPLDNYAFAVQQLFLELAKQQTRN